MKARNIAITQPLFIKSFKLAKSNLGKIGLMVLFDLLFLGSSYALYNIGLFFAQNIALPQNSSIVLVFLALTLVYYLIVLFAYSFFKYSVLDAIKSLFDKTEFSFKRLGRFYALNIVLGVILFLSVFFANLILVNTKPQYRVMVFLLFAVPYLLLFYVIANISHSLFYKGYSIKEALKKSLKMTFTRISIYRETILAIILVALLMWLFLLGLGYLVRLSGNNYSLYLTLYSYFTNFSAWATAVVFYLAILINRISFYAIVRESK